MKPMGAIPPELRNSRTLALGGKPATDWIPDAGGTPLFVYDFGLIAARIDRLRAALPAPIAVHYAIKANPFPPLLADMAPIVDGFDVASLGEMQAALRTKAAAAISIAGPGKRDEELAEAIEAGVTINLESEGEWVRAERLAGTIGRRPRVAVRVNPEFELRGSGMRMGGRASPFGVDADRVPPLVKRILASGAEWRGFHIFTGSQALDAAAIIEAQAETLALAGNLAEAVGGEPPLVNLGGGFGIPYFAGDAPLDVEAVGAALAEALARRPAVLAESRFAIELGRWLVGEAGVYLTRVIDRKESRGETFLVCDGGLNHQLAASGNFGTVVRRNYPIGVVGRIGDQPEETVNVVGPLCTPLDRLGDQIALPKAQVGDVIAVFLAGAYGLTASPQAFLGHPQAREILVGI